MNSHDLPGPDPILIDGGLGTELELRGVPMPAGQWSAAAVMSSPEVLSDIHAEYAAAGATVHCANTFRTRPANVGPDFRHWIERAVGIARTAVAGRGWVAGTLGMVGDCYRPDQSPRNPRPAHREMAGALAEAGCDLLFCETFSHPREALVAVEEASRTGCRTWVSLTAGPRGSLLTPAEVGAVAPSLAAAGASAILVNCLPAAMVGRYLAALGEAVDTSAVRIGAYANAGDMQAGLGWSRRPSELQLRAYADYAEAWVAAGARVVGGCCGTGPAHIRAIHQRLTTPRH